MMLEVMFRGMGHSQAVQDCPPQAARDTAPAPVQADGKAHTARVRRLISAFILVGLFALTFFGVFHFRESLSQIGPWGYLSAFVVELVGSATLFIPTSGRAYTMSMALVLDPFMLGLLGGIGAALGEYTGYYVGAKGGHILKGKRFYRWFHKMAERHLGMVLFVLALLPVPFDAAGLWAGAVRYPLTRFFLYVAPGKIMKMTAITLAVHYGITWMLGPLV